MPYIIQKNTKKLWTNTLKETIDKLKKLFAKQDTEVIL